MDKILRRVRRHFIATIVLVVVLVVFLSWGILQYFNSTEIGVPAHISEVHKTAEDNKALAAYIEEQRAFEAHFVSLASSIKEQESQRVTQGLAATTIIAVSVGIAASVVASRKLIKPVEEAYRSQERFIQDAAHELRNPLAAMSAAIQQADEKTAKSPLVKTIQRQTNRLVHINEDLLFLERRSDNEIHKISLSDLLLDVVEELQPIAASRRITVNVHTDDGIIKNMSTGDYVRLVKNVIDNAIKYSKNNSTITITQTKQNGYIELIVADKGIGIPKQEVGRIGSRFYRAKNTGEIDGTGLGLAIVQKILNTYGGSKSITSRVNYGTTVTLRLPA